MYMEYEYYNIHFNIKIKRRKKVNDTKLKVYL